MVSNSQPWGSFADRRMILCGPLLDIKADVSAIPIFFCRVVALGLLFMSLLGYHSAGSCQVSRKLISQVTPSGREGYPVTQYQSSLFKKLRR